MRILITGATGMLGATLCHMLKENHEVFATGNSDAQFLEVPYLQFDLSESNLQPLIDWAKPELIILSGAITNGNFCQNNPEEALKVNGLSVFNILNATEKSIQIVYISTDAVFPATLSKAKENDAVLPENVYGKSKELGEFFLNSTLDRRYTIIRTTIVGLNLNPSKQGFVEWILNSAKKKENLGLFGDVKFSPISIWELADEINFLISNDAINGETLHIAGANCTKFEFGNELLSLLNLSKETLKETSIMAFRDRAKRSTDQTLDSTYYERKYGRRLPSLTTTINRIKTYYDEQN